MKPKFVLIALLALTGAVIFGGVYRNLQDAGLTDATSPSPIVRPVKADWRAGLPDESAELRSKLASDPFLEGWLRGQDLWVGYADQDDLARRGYFVNVGFKYTGQGIQPAGVPKASCSVIGFNGEAICGVGAFDSPAWGISPDEAGEKIRSILRE